MRTCARAHEDAVIRAPSRARVFAAAAKARAPCQRPCNTRLSQRKAHSRARVHTQHANCHSLRKPATGPRQRTETSYWAPSANWPRSSSKCSMCGRRLRHADCIRSLVSSCKVTKLRTICDRETSADGKNKLLFPASVQPDSVTYSVDPSIELHTGAALGGMEIVQLVPKRGIIEPAMRYQLQRRPGQLRARESRGREVMKG
eukprot:754649-Pleurochrysis_carterae.AAC.1